MGRTLPPQWRRQRADAELPCGAQCPGLRCDRGFLRARRQTLRAEARAAGARRALPDRLEAPAGARSCGGPARHCVVEPQAALVRGARHRGAGPGTGAHTAIPALPRSRGPRPYPRFARPAEGAGRRRTCLCRSRHGGRKQHRDCARAAAHGRRQRQVRPRQRRTALSDWLRRPRPAAALPPGAGRDHGGAPLPRSYLSLAPTVCSSSCAITMLFSPAMARSEKRCTTPTSPFCRPCESGVRSRAAGSW